MFAGRPRCLITRLGGPPRRRSSPDPLPFPIRFTERQGDLATLDLGGRDGDEAIACQLRDDGSFEEGDLVTASFAPGHLHLFDAEGQALGKAGE